MPNEKPRSAITPTRADDYAEWYQQVIKAAELAENSLVRGCMVIKPWGMALWENMQRALDARFKETGHENAYFPLFIPLSLLQKEADHVEGFAKECAVVTHHRLKAGPDGRLVPDGELEEPLIVRPTSETIISEAFSRWIQSYRDLPLLINQWNNVVRWEMRPRLFLRTAEFLWQEGHTAHATADDGMAETKQMLGIYEQFARTYLAIPVVPGEKTSGERFPGAVATMTIEALMQDRKALQLGTSHFLGQNFAKAKGIKYLSKEGKQEFVWTTSWGVSTRLIGGLIMTHADDNGMVMPPMIAPTQVQIMPLARGAETDAETLEYARKLETALRGAQFGGGPIRVKIDNRTDKTPDRIWRCIKMGVPLRVDIGQREAKAGTVSYERRDQPPKTGKTVAFDEFVAQAPQLLAEIQQALFDRASKSQDEATADVKSVDDFRAFFREDAPGGFARCFAADDPSYRPLLEELKVTPRVIAFQTMDQKGECIFTKKPDAPLVLFARAY
jgi:prolyl-tRNA synthetase